MNKTMKNSAHLKAALIIQYKQTYFSQLLTLCLFQSKSCSLHLQ